MNLKQIISIHAKRSTQEVLDLHMGHRKYGMIKGVEFDQYEKSHDQRILDRVVNYYGIKKEVAKQDFQSAVRKEIG